MNRQTKILSLVKRLENDINRVCSQYRTDEEVHYSNTTNNGQWVSKRHHIVHVLRRLPVIIRDIRLEVLLNNVKHNQ